jgi:hypothetical protein
MSTVLTADNSSLLSQIGSKVCQAIIAIQVQQPELLLDKYREIPWQSSRHQSGLVNKLVEILGQTKDEKLTQQLLRKFLGALLAPESFSSPILVSLFKEVSQLNNLKDNNKSGSGATPVLPNENGNGASKTSENKANLNSGNDSSGSVENKEPVSTLENPITNASETESKTNSVEEQAAATVENNSSEALEAESTNQPEQVQAPETKDKTPETTASINNASYMQGGVAVLLLDAENLQFNSGTEKFLSSVCQYPIQVKVAFANWCRKGKLDADLHGRNYDLIHVPSGKDNADGKMITFGSSISQRFPNAKEVFVCSSDNVMTNLCNHMMQNGLNVYRVVKQGSNLTVLDIQSGTTHVHTVLPTIEQFVSQIKDIICDEESRTGNQWMKLSKVSKIFHNKYHIGVNQVVSHYFQGKTAKELFVEHAEFAVHHLPDDLETFIALFKLPQANK